VIGSSACRPTGACTPADGEDAAAWQPVCDGLEAQRGIEHATLLLGDDSGLRLTWTRGDVAPDTRVPIASASKWLAGAAIMAVVEEGALTLDDTPQQHLAWASGDGERGGMTLRQLLSFTSGLELSPIDASCKTDRRTTHAACAQEIYETTFVHPPGTAFTYGPAHLYVASAMATAATGEDWHALFDTRVADVVGMTDDPAFDGPSLDNPNTAGGAKASARDYQRFLQAIVAGELLADSLDEMHADHTPAPDVELVYTPVPDDYAWHYGLASWRECMTPSFDDACAASRRVSSPGAKGFYPWIDLDTGRWGVLATDRVPLRASIQSVELVSELRDAIDAGYGASSGEPSS
jgi:CubicO group peptidase (beta-lactamase class C family)